MPGIAGIVTRERIEEGAQLLKAMLDSMMHEPFYVQASHIDQAHGWFGGSVAINRSFADCMPVFNETKDMTLFFAGECFNNHQMMTALRAKGHDFNLNDASHLVHMYEEKGPGFVKNLNGWFSGLILDNRNSRTVLFNDRYGMHRIYYHEGKSAFYFASEAKAILKVVPSLREADIRSVAEYLCFDCVLEERTYFRGINVLPGGALWVSNGGAVQKRSHYDASQSEVEYPMESGKFLDQLTSTFASILPRYLAGERLTIALTGGLDTRLIMAYLPRDCKHVTAFTFGGMYRDSMDVRISKILSKELNIHHETVRLDAHFLSEYPRYAARAVYMTDGLADVTNADSIYLDSQVRDLAQIKLMGTFGSQVLGRVRRALRYRPPATELINADFHHQINSVSGALTPFQHEHDLTYVLKREIPWYWSRFTVPQMSQMILRSPFLDNELIDLLYCAPRESFDGSKFEVSAISQKRGELLKIRTNKGLGGQSAHLISSIIMMLIRTRGLADKILNWDVLPFSLQHSVTRIETYFLSPLHLNKLILGWEYFRHYSIWFRRELAGFLKNILLDERTLSRPYWNGPFVKRMVHDHVEGHRRYLSEIRKVLTLELIHRLLIEGDAGY